MRHTPFIHWMRFDLWIAVSVTDSSLRWQNISPSSSVMNSSRFKLQNFLRQNKAYVNIIIWNRKMLTCCEQSYPQLVNRTPNHTKQLQTLWLSWKTVHSSAPLLMYNLSYCALFSEVSCSCCSKTWKRFSSARIETHCSYIPKYYTEFVDRYPSATL